MSEYSELIKRFDKIRDYMRNFYVFGFQSRGELSGCKPGKSGRSYDNERRRIESYLADYMTFRHDRTGKSLFLSVDSGAMPENPLYRPFRAKTFTKNDITLHFCVLDLLADGVARGAGEIAEEIDRRYLCAFQQPGTLDVSTIRKKLIEYEKLGILESRKEGKAQKYSIYGAEPAISREALLFFSEISPLGVFGSYLMERAGLTNDLFTWKHHYIMNALDSQVCCQLTSAISERRQVEITSESGRSERTTTFLVQPLMILTSGQSGRQYLAAYHLQRKAIWSFRLDYIKSVTLMQPQPQLYAQMREKAEALYRQCWSVSLGNGRELQSLAMELRVGRQEEFLAERIRREGRHGRLEQVGEERWRYTIEVWDAMEMLPWLRTFTGRILHLTCSNPEVEETFQRDLSAMYRLYGIGGSGQGEAALWSIRERECEEL